MKVCKNIPDGIDYSLFKWLKRGDRIQIAADTNMSESMVRATLRGVETFNAEIIAKGMEKVIERMKPVLEKQQEAQRLLQAINNMKAA